MATTPSPFLLVWHITRRDLWHLRWAILLGIVLAIADALTQGLVPRAMVESSRTTQDSLESLAMLLPPLRVLYFVVTAALLVMLDSPAVSEAFWLTRPIAPRTLCLSKILSGALILIVPSLVVQLALMASFDVPFADLALVVPDLVVAGSFTLMLVLLAGSLVPNLAQLTLWMVGIGFTVWIGMLSAVSWYVNRLDDSVFQPLMPSTNDHTDQFMILVFVAIALALAMYVQFRRRRRGRTLLVAVAGIIAAAGLGAIWPIPLFGSPPRLQEDWAQDPSRSPVRLVRDIRHIRDVTSVRNMGRTPPGRLRQIAAPVRLEGVPPSGFLIEQLTTNARLTLDNGTVLEGLRSKAIAIDPARGVEVAQGNMQLAQLGTPPPMPPPQHAVEIWPVLLRIHADDLTRAGATQGTYTGTLVYSFTRREPLGTRPLATGDTRFADGPRSVTIWRHAQQPDACEVGIQTTATYPTGWDITRPTLLHFFRHRVTGESLSMFVQTMPGTASLAHAAFGFESSPRFRVEATRFSLQRAGVAGQVPPVSCHDVEVEFVRESFAGRIERTITIPNFGVQPAPGDLTEIDQALQHTRPRE